MASGMRGAGREATRGMYALRIDNGVLVIAGPTAMWVEKSNDTRPRLEESFSRAFGRRVALRFVHVPAESGEEQSAAPAQTSRRPTPPSLEALASGLFQAKPVSDDPDDLPDPFTE
jgi:hypothetical protein